MMVVDYYDILQIPPSANLAEIKAAYRRLAQIYHPDKNQGNKYTNAYFNAVKEAYETLSKPALREKYLQGRWLAKSNNQPFTQKIITPEILLKKILLAGRTVLGMDIFRMDKRNAFESLNNLLSDDNISLLNSFNEQDVNDVIVNQYLQLSLLFDYKAQFMMLERLKLIKSSRQNALTLRIRQLKNNALLEKMQPYFIAALVLLLCIIIAMAA